MLFIGSSCIPDFDRPKIIKVRNEIRKLPDFVRSCPWPHNFGDIVQWKNVKSANRLVRQNIVILQITTKPS